MFYRWKIESFNCLWWRRDRIKMNMRRFCTMDLFSYWWSSRATEDPGTIQVADENVFLFMQDNAPCHKAAEILEFLAENQIPVMEWPPQSPDLNPIENLWSELKTRFHKRFYGVVQSSIEEFGSQISLWRDHARSLIQSGDGVVEALIESMPRRVQAVIEAKGDWTKY